MTGAETGSKPKQRRTAKLKHTVLMTRIDKPVTIADHFSISYCLPHHHFSYRSLGINATLPAKFTFSEIKAPMLQISPGVSPGVLEYLVRMNCPIHVPARGR